MCRSSKGSLRPETLCRPSPQETLSVDIKPGWKSGTRVTFDGKGAPRARWPNPWRLGARPGGSACGGAWRAAASMRHRETLHGVPACLATRPDRRETGGACPRGRRPAAGDRAGGRRVCDQGEAARRVPAREGRPGVHAARAAGRRAVRRPARADHAGRPRAARAGVGRGQRAGGVGRGRRGHADQQGAGRPRAPPSRSALCLQPHAPRARRRPAGGATCGCASRWCGRRRSAPSRRRRCGASCRRADRSPAVRDPPAGPPRRATLCAASDECQDAVV